MSQNSEKAINTSQESGIKYWWKIVFVLSLGWVFMYATRTILNPVMPNIAEQYGLSNTQLGLISSIFFLTYAVAQIPGGALGDKIGRKYVLVPGFILFGLFTGISGLTLGFGFFLLARAIAGIGQGTFYGPAYAISSESIPESKLTMGTAIINSGMAVGISLGYLLSSNLVLDRGMKWSVPFYVMTIPTILVALLIFFVVKEKRKKSVSKDVAAEQDVEVAEKIDWIAILKSRNIIITFIMVFCSLYGFFMVLTWLPQFLQVERGFAGNEVGFISSLVPWASIPGALLFAFLTDKLGRRKPLIFFLVPLSAIAILSIAYIENITIMITALIAYGLFGKLALDPVLLSFCARNAPKSAYSTIFGVYNFVGMSSSILAPFITGYISDVTGSMQSGFFIAAILLMVGFVAMLFAKETPDVKTA